MANIVILDGASATKYRKATGAGSDGDPFVTSVVVDSIAAGDNNIGNVDIASSLPAGSNAIGKLSANSGVDIGDVDITSIVPGTAATNLGKAEDAGHTSGDVGVMALTVRQDTATALGGADADYQPLITDATGRLHVISKPFSAMLEGGLTELVGINEQIDQNDYAGSVGVALGGSYSGEILAVAFYATEDGSGAIQDSAGILYVFDADPSVSSGATVLASGVRETTIGKLAIGSADWDTDTNGGLAYVPVSIPFHAVSTLYFTWKHLDATALNDAAGDDEQLEFNFWWKRES